MRICLLTTQDLDAVPFADNDWPCDPRPYLPEHEWHLAVLDDKRESVDQVERLIREDDFDLYFNLCDGAADDAMKKACRQIGIATPAYVVARKEADVERAARTLSFPLFVKHHSSYASIDLSRRSRVQTPAGLRIQARKIMRRHGAALIEEYVDGTECTVLVTENPDDAARPTTYTPMQYRFPEGESFKHADLKWVDYDSLVSFPVADAELAARLRDEAGRFFVALGAASFARCDMRVDREGTAFMLEINANCGVFYPESAAGSADLCLLQDPAGHVGFARQLVAAAFARHGRARSSRGRR
ncbi:MAG: D-alanine--D-alanine ligase family protein [Planctomycetota bacterium]|jgi:D-alanine-D-alanine ligase